MNTNAFKTRLITYVVDRTLSCGYKVIRNLLMSKMTMTSCVNVTKIKRQRVDIRFLTTLRFKNNLSIFKKEDLLNAIF